MRWLQHADSRPLLAAEGSTLRQKCTKFLYQKEVLLSWTSMPRIWTVRDSIATTLSLMVLTRVILQRFIGEEMQTISNPSDSLTQKPIVGHGMLVCIHLISTLLVAKTRTLAPMYSFVIFSRCSWLHRFPFCNGRECLHSRSSRSSIRNISSIWLEVATFCSSKEHLAKMGNRGDHYAYRIEGEIKEENLSRGMSISAIVYSIHCYMYNVVQNAIQITFFC